MAVLWSAVPLSLGLRSLHLDLHADRICRALILGDGPEVLPAVGQVLGHLGQGLYMHLEVTLKGWGGGGRGREG